MKRLLLFFAAGCVLAVFFELVKYAFFRVVDWASDIIDPCDWPLVIAVALVVVWGLFYLIIK